ncbi:hypothetical protein [uncultured Selenomonas sp.]|jgi:hypothetical protein|uniref:hypothetical protein n=1 Tax=uncultured Selenomonas sp. TaxID=159275 RepID=UPI00280528B1|nr:hypothetical protein [uncultured Selenomonas sp.]
MGFFKKIFKPNIPSTPTITGRELVSSTSSEEPDSPQMGTDGVNQKKKGLSSLLVQSENIYKGGV